MAFTEEIADKLARISHTFCQNQPEAADSLKLPYVGEKQRVWKTNSTAPRKPGLRFTRAKGSYWL